MKRIVTLSFLLLTVVTFAQPTEKDERKERLKAHKIAFISTELDLTPEQAEKFWPVYNELEAKLEEIHQERKKLSKQMKEFDELADEEAYSITEQIFELEVKEMELRREYLPKFADVIGKKKAAKVFFAEEKFKRELLRKLKHNEHKGGHQNGGQGGGNDGPPRNR